MNKYLISLFFAWLVLGGKGHAASLTGEVTLTGVQWNNAVQVLPEQWMPQQWLNVGPESVAAWQPAIPYVTGGRVLLRRIGNYPAQVELDVEVTGVQYLSNQSGRESTPFFNGNAILKNGIYTKTGIGQSGQFYSHSLELPFAQTPFTMVRPLLGFNDIALAFRNQPNGVYEGQIQISLPFVYRRADNEMVTHRTLSLWVPIRLVNRSTTCDVPNDMVSQEINFGIIGADQLYDGSANSKTVRFAVQCNQPIAFGGMTLIGLSGQTGSNDILATTLDGLGIMLLPRGQLSDVYLNEQIVFSDMFAPGTTYFDLSFDAKPIALAENIEFKPFRANVRIDVEYF